jgi:hypothetical protein
MSKNRQGTNALQMALLKGHADIVSLLNKEGPAGTYSGTQSPMSGSPFLSLRKDTVGYKDLMDLSMNSSIESNNSSGSIEFKNSNKRQEDLENTIKTQMGELQAMKAELDQAKMVAQENKDLRRRCDELIGTSIQKNIL